MDNSTRKSLQKKESFINETQNMMGATINVFENLKTQHKSIFNVNNFQNISKEAFEMKYFDNLQNEISGNVDELKEGNHNNSLSRDEKKKKEIENSLQGFKEELQIYKNKIKDHKGIEKKIREDLCKSEVKISQYNSQVK